MRSTLARGVVRHRRTTPHAYEFEYGVYYVHLDLDEINAVDRKIKLLSHNKPNALSFRDADHMAHDQGSLRESMHTYLRDRDIDPDSVHVSLMTNARVLGYVFNPVSFYFVRDRANSALKLVIAEVHNTHGEEHLYDLTREEGGDVYGSSAEKSMYVSPFIEMVGHYRFECHELPGAGYDLRIDEYKPDERACATAEPFFQAQLVVTPVPMTNANVAKMLLRYPFMTLRTIYLIHWQGLKLWLRGVKFLPHRPKEEAGA